MNFWVFGKSKPNVEGYIGYYELTDWWLSTFTEAEREYIEQRFQPTGLPPAKWGVAPWYYEQLAIIYRKRKGYDSELRILGRFAEQKHGPGIKPAKLLARLEKAKQLRRAARRS